MFYSFTPIQTGSNWFRQKKDVLLIQTQTGFKLVQAGCKMFYSIKPIQTGSNWHRQDARCFTISNTDWFQTGTGRMQDVLLIQTYSDWFKLVQAGCKMFYSFKPIQTGSNWLKQDASCFNHSYLFRQAHTGSCRTQDVLLIQTYSYWFILVQAGCKMFWIK